MEGVSRSEIRSYVKTCFKLHRNKGKDFIIRHLRPGIRQKWIHNWEAASRDHLIRRIRKCVREFDMDIIINMFNSLKDKIHQANESGLTSLN